MTDIEAHIRKVEWLGKNWDRKYDAIQRLFDLYRVEDAMKEKDAYIKNGGYLH